MNVFVITWRANGRLDTQIKAKNFELTPDNRWMVFSDGSGAQILTVCAEEILAVKKV